MWDNLADMESSDLFWSTHMERMYNRDLEHWVNAADRLLLLLSHLPPDLEDDGADGQEGGDPGERDQKASIHRGPLQSPAPAHDASQRLTRECLGEEVGNVPFKKMIKFTSNY